MNDHVALQIYDIEIANIANYISATPKFRSGNASRGNFLFFPAGSLALRPGEWWYLQVVGSKIQETLPGRKFLNVYVLMRLCQLKNTPSISHKSK